jgi:hypothetical protein
MTLGRGARRRLQELVIDDVQSDQRDRRGERPRLGDANARPDMRPRERFDEGRRRHHLTW